MGEQTLKPGWKWVKFGDVVKLNKDRSADPVADGIERYVGLEHIEPEDLRIRRWGLVKEGTTFTNRFKPGQVLFGKRRAYQRKVAVADFEGVCSGDIYVFEPKNDCLLPELLPFICQTEAFFEHAVGTSAGSLSPRTNWKQLANFEFALPPLEEQRQIAKIALAASNNLDALRDLQISADGLIHSFRKELSATESLNGYANMGLSGYMGPWELMPLDNLVELKRDSVDVVADQVYQEIGIRSFGRGVFIKEPNTGDSLGNKRVFWIQPGRLIVNVVFAWEGAVAVTSPETKGLIGSHRFPMYERKSSQIDINYIRHYLLSPDGLTKLLQASPGGAGRNKTLGQQSFLKITIPVPPVDIQKEISDQAERLIEAERQADCRFESAHRLMRTIIESKLDVSRERTNA